MVGGNIGFLNEDRPSPTRRCGVLVIQGKTYLYLYIYIYYMCIYIYTGNPNKGTQEYARPIPKNVRIQVAILILHLQIFEVALLGSQIPSFLY